MGKKLFDFCIGNPPYQEQNDQNGRQPPVYHLFMDTAYEIASCVELITPARFLFNAGQTPKAWNQKILNDVHFKVINYTPDAGSIFPNTDIKGGCTVTLRNEKKEFGAITVFTAYPELNRIIKAVSLIQGEDGKYIDTIVSSRGNYRTTEKFTKQYPYAVKRLGKGTGNMIASNFFEKLPELLEDQSGKKNDYYQFLCRIDNKRTICNISKQFVQDNDFIRGYNVACPKSNGSGHFGEILSSTEILEPNEGATDTFISIGIFDTLNEARNLQKYIKTKFFRALLGAKKVTQDNPKNVWSMIPLQDFTPSSDIDWSKSIHEIDLQNNKKYGLNQEEIDFIEKNVKEMA